MTENTTETDAREEVQRGPSTPLNQEDIGIMQEYVDRLRTLPIWPQKAIMAGHEVLMLVTVIQDENGEQSAAPIAIIPDFWMVDEAGFLQQGDNSLPAPEGFTRATEEWLEQNWRPVPPMQDFDLGALLQQMALTGGYDASDTEFTTDIPTQEG